MKYIQFCAKNILPIFISILWLASINAHADIAQSSNQHSKRDDNIQFRADGRIWKIAGGNTWDHGMSHQLTYVPQGQSLQDHTELFTLLVQDNQSHLFPTLGSYLSLIDKKNRTDYKSVKIKILSKTSNTIRYRIISTGYRGDATDKLIYQSQGKIIKTNAKIYLAEYSAIVNEVSKNQIAKSTMTMVNAFNVEK